TQLFHNPAHAQQWTEPDIETEFEALVKLLMRGLRA
ncbi:MAG: TetR/AcrR family transcriptional regulator, partial [Streptomyces sp.]|nr:TetR/AcrR family transcriptional regulator [Streptomyces sp.]